MATQTLSDVTILLRNDTASNWTTENPVLSKGEVGIEIDTNKFKIGDGVKTWSQLSYCGSVVAASNTNGHITIDGTDTTVYTLPTGGSSIGGVKTTSSGAGTVAIDSSGAMALNNSGATAGTYTKVTVNSKGVVTSGENLSANDVPTITLAKISDAGTAASKNTGTSSGNVPVLDANGKLNTSVMPALDSPALTGTPTAPTPSSANDNTTNIATTAWTRNYAIANLPILGYLDEGVVRLDSSKDLDTTTTLGTYVWSASYSGGAPSNRPCNYGKMVVQNAVGSTAYMQIVFNCQTPEIYMRLKTSSSWGGWYKAGFTAV